jgi:hypothetical protein
MDTKVHNVTDLSGLVFPAMDDAERRRLLGLPMALLDNMKRVAPDVRAALYP